MGGSTLVFVPPASIVARCARCARRNPGMCGSSPRRPLPKLQDSVLASAVDLKPRLSPAWNGSRATVARGLRLICNGALDGTNAKVGELAGRLGIGERHLVRLFSKYLGASPSQVGKTLRVQRVKRLLDTTDLPISEVALAAGFSSLRRFNAVVFDVYGRSPTELRRIRRRRWNTASAPVRSHPAA